MTASKIRSMTADDQDAAIGTLVLAFAADPMTRWTWQQSKQYLAGMPEFARVFGAKAFTSGTAYCTEDYSGVALWLPPGVEPDEEEMGEVIQRALPPSRLSDADPIFEAMAKYHPKEPHWYLPLIGVDPTHQRRGLGDALMVHALERCDRDGTPAYLESSNPKNLSLYRRHGFEPIGEIQAGSSPKVVPMLRRPR